MKSLRPDCTDYITTFMSACRGGREEGGRGGAEGEETVGGGKRGGKKSEKEKGMEGIRRKEGRKKGRKNRFPETNENDKNNISNSMTWDKKDH
jgi:hypothetical protein